MQTVVIVLLIHYFLSSANHHCCIFKNLRWLDRSRAFLSLALIASLFQWGQSMLRLLPVFWRGQQVETSSNFAFGGLAHLYNGSQCLTGICVSSRANPMLFLLHENLANSNLTVFGRLLGDPPMALWSCTFQRLNLLWFVSVLICSVMAGRRVFASSSSNRCYLVSLSSWCIG